MRQALAGRGAAIGELHSRNSASFWRALRDVRPLATQGPAALLWRLSVPPASGAAVAAALDLPGRAYYFDWGGGLIWLALPPAADAHAARVRAAIAGGGHATLVRSPDAVRAAVPVFQPQPDALAALSRRVKEAFDPRGVLNPGRMGF